MKLGIFGGSFDPVHLGHLMLAESCREQLALDKVWLVPAPAPPHKRGQTLSPFKQRVEMLELAVAGNPAFIVSQLERDRAGLSFTVDTLRAIHDDQPNAELFLLLGADSLHDLPNWREAAEVCRLAILVVVARPGEPEPDYSTLQAIADQSQIDFFSQHRVTSPLMDLSSSEIRRRVAAGKSIRWRVSRAVEAYIAEQGLYCQ